MLSESKSGLFFKYLYLKLLKLLMFGKCSELPWLHLLLKQTVRGVYLMISAFNKSYFFCSRFLWSKRTNITFLVHNFITIFKCIVLQHVACIFSKVHVSTRSNFNLLNSFFFYKIINSIIVNCLTYYIYINFYFLFT